MQTTNNISSQCPPNSHIFINDNKMCQCGKTSRLPATTETIPKLYGWICPNCGVGHSPYTPSCSCKKFLDHHYQNKFEITC